MRWCASILSAVLLIFWASIVADAQQQNSKLQTMYSGQATTTTFTTAATGGNCLATSPPFVPCAAVQNAGQAFHQVHVILRDGAGVCNPSTVGQTIIRLYANQEPTNTGSAAHIFRIGTTLTDFSYLPIGPGPTAPASTATNRGQGYIYATGVYRDLRLVIENLATNCVVDAFYAGSIQGDLNPSVISANGGYLNGRFVRGINISAAGDNTVLAAVTNAAGTCCQIGIDDLTLYNTGVQTVIVKVGAFSWYNLVNWAAGCSLVRELTPGTSKVLGNIGDAFIINLSVGSQVTGEVAFHYE
jgi:hypothetical protein